MVVFWLANSCWRDSFTVIASSVERNTPGTEMAKSPGQTNLSRLGPSVKAELPFVKVLFDHHTVGMFGSVASRSTKEFPAVEGIVHS